MKHQNNDKLNQHDPFNKHVWANDKEYPAWILVKIVGGGSIAAALLICLTLGVLSL